MENKVIVRKHPLQIQGVSVVVVQLLSRVQLFAAPLAGACQASLSSTISGVCSGCRFVGKIPWRRKWQPTPVLLPGESHGWKSLVGYNPWGRKESDTTEQLHFTPPHSFCIFDNYLVKFTYDFSRSICTESNIIMIFFLLLLQTQYKFNTKSQRYTG